MIELRDMPCFGTINARIYALTTVHASKTGATVWHVKCRSALCEAAGFDKTFLAHCWEKVRHRSRVCDTGDNLGGSARRRGVSAASGAAAWRLSSELDAQGHRYAHIARGLAHVAGGDEGGEVQVTIRETTM